MLERPSKTALANMSAACVGCGKLFPISATSLTAPCGQNLQIKIAPPASVEVLRDMITNSAHRSMWRYEPLLPALQTYASHLQVGGTPLLDLGVQRGARLWLKDDTRNPSGSLKDRASEMVLAVAASQGIDQVVMASTGNAAASIAAVGAAYNARVTVLVPEDIPAPKLAQIRAYGAEVYKIAGGYGAACAVAGRLAQARGAINRTTGVNPFTREGKKTCAYEIAEQMGWRAPDWVIVPTGDGNILSAMGKGFTELLNAGLIEQMPRLVAVQTTAACPIAHEMDAQQHSQRAATTYADSINVRDPMDGPAALAALRASKGCAVTVDDAALSRALLSASSTFGVLLEPSSAAAIAAFEQLCDTGAIGAKEEVVVVGTGTGLKDLRIVVDASEREEVAVIDPEEWQSLIPVNGNSA